MLDYWVLYVFMNIISISLSFAYDTMIFSKAMALDAAALKRVLDLYAIALGQVKLREVFHEI